MFQKELLLQERGRSDDWAVVDLSWRGASALVDAVRTLDWTRTNRELNHRLRVLMDPGGDNPLPVGSLGVELRALGVHYPALRHLTGESDGTATLQVSEGLLLVLTVSGLEVRGNLDDMRDLPQSGVEPGGHRFDDL